LLWLLVVDVCSHVTSYIKVWSAYLNPIWIGPCTSKIYAKNF